MITQILTFIWIWSMMAFMGIGIVTTFLMFYRGGVIQLDIDKFLNKPKKELEETDNG